MGGEVDVDYINEQITKVTRYEYEMFHYDKTHSFYIYLTDCQMPPTEASLTLGKLDT